MIPKKKEKPTPLPCICGKAPVTVKSRPGSMLTCPDLLNCPRNIRTTWHRSGGADSMVTEWNKLVTQAEYEKKRKTEKMEVKYADR